jgi:hypothetical protein
MLSECWSHNLLFVSAPSPINFILTTRVISEINVDMNFGRCHLSLHMSLHLIWKWKLYLNFILISDGQSDQCPIFVKTMLRLLRRPCFNS